MLLDFLFHPHREMLSLPYKREIHCHLIPGVDDGSETPEDSLQYVRALAEMGVRNLIFTPHHTEPKFLNTPEIIEPKYQALCQEVTKAGIPVNIEGYSFEYRIDSSFIQMSESGKWGEAQCQLRPLKGRYVLVENGFNQPLYNLEDVLRDLQERGWFPIMAHPERYLYYVERGLSAYEHLADLGVEFQCNMLSFSGYYGRHTQKMALQLLEEGMISYLGSDLHNDKYVKALQDYLRSSDYAHLRDDLEMACNNDKL